MTEKSHTHHYRFVAKPYVCVCMPMCVYLSVIYPHDPCVRWMSVEYETHRESLSPVDQTELPSPLTSGLLFPSLAAAEMIAPSFTPSLALLTGQVGG